MANDVTVTFGVDLSGLVSGLEDARDQVASAADAMNASFQDASQASGDALGGLFGGIGDSVAGASRSFNDLGASALQQTDGQGAAVANMLGTTVAAYGAMGDADRNFNDQSQQNDQKTVKESTENWTRLGTTVRSSFSSALAGMIVGTTSFEKAIQQMAQRVLSELINMSTQMVWTWLFGEEQKTTGSAGNTAQRKALQQSEYFSALFNEEQQTDASTEGAAQRTAVQQSEYVTAMSYSASKSVASIGNYALETFAGVFAFLSDMMGPAAAGPAAASEAAVASAAGSIAFAERGFDVPRDTLAYLHKDEMVLPSALAGQVRSAAASGGGGGAPTINVSFSAHGRMSADEILGHSQVIARAVARELRHFNPHLRSR